MKTNKQIKGLSTKFLEERHEYEKKILDNIRQEKILKEMRAITDPIFKKFDKSKEPDFFEIGDSLVKSRRNESK